MDPRGYQLQAIKSIDECDGDCIVKMFCGTGKSLVMFKYVIDRPEIKYAVFVFPSLALITQFRKDYIKKFKVKRPFLCVSSEDESTTNSDEIETFLENDEKIVCVTYQSFHTLMDVSEEPDIIMFDEAHHAKDIYIESECKKVYFTATPIGSMDDEDSEYGPIVFEYSHHEGVVEEKLNDFNIMIDFSSENTNESVYDSIARAILKTGNSRVLTFHQTVNTENDTSVINFVQEDEFKKSFNKIAKDFPNHKFTSITFVSLSADDSTETRCDILGKFDKTSDNEITIISSCRTIGEGVDTKKANMVVFVDAKRSLVEIIQNIGRIVRKQEKDSTILIPCWVDKTKYDTCETEEEHDKVIRDDLGKDGNFSCILNVLSALRQSKV
jgi:superfamily II DNA or RNA helicase